LILIEASAKTRIVLSCAYGGPQRERPARPGLVRVEPFRLRETSSDGEAEEPPLVLLTLTSGIVALAHGRRTALADELLGVLTKVDVEGKKLTVVEKDTDKEIEITVMTRQRRSARKEACRSTSRSSPRE